MTTQVRIRSCLYGRLCTVLLHYCYSCNSSPGIEHTTQTCVPHLEPDLFPIYCNCFGSEGISNSWNKSWYRVWVLLEIWHELSLSCIAITNQHNWEERGGCKWSRRHACAHCIWQKHLGSKEGWNSVQDYMENTTLAKIAIDQSLHLAISIHNPSTEEVLLSL